MQHIYSISAHPSQKVDVTFLVLGVFIHMSLDMCFRSIHFIALARCITEIKYVCNIVTASIIIYTMWIWMRLWICRFRCFQKEMRYNNLQFQFLWRFFGWLVVVFWVAVCVRERLLSPPSNNRTFVSFHRYIYTSQQCIMYIYTYSLSMRKLQKIKNKK